MIKENSVTGKYIFSGHDSFQCRQLWLKKGYDFIKNGKSFNDEDAVIQLGVGKNMVSSIRFWLKAFNIINTKDSLTEFGMKLFDDENGFDPFLEDEASIWLLHYQLVKSGYSAIYSIIFNEFRKEKVLFNKASFLSYVKRRNDANTEFNFSDNTLSKDFDVFINLYKSDSDSKNVEDSFGGILSDIDLLKTTDTGKEIKYLVENTIRDGLPAPIILFSILDNPNYGNSIGINSLEFDVDSPGSIFAISRVGLINKISELTDKYKYINFSDQAGIKELQFKHKVSAYSILNEYYGK